VNPDEFIYEQNAAKTRGEQRAHLQLLFGEALAALGKPLRVPVVALASKCPRPYSVRYDCALDAWVYEAQGGGR
jgi:hypothetical protein